MRGDPVERAADTDAYRVLATVLRAQIAQRIRGHQDDYRPDCAMEAEPTPGADDGDHPKTWEAWMDSLTRPKRWICQLTLKAGAQRWVAKIAVLQKQPDGFVV